MYVLILTYRLRQCEYVGPFPSARRAREYAAEAVKQYGEPPVRSSIQPMIQPYAVVREVIWRDHAEPTDEDH